MHEAFFHKRTFGYKCKNTNGARSLLFRLSPSTIEAVKIELHIQGCQQLVPDILSQSVIWADHIYVLEYKLVFDVKEVQCNKSFARFVPGKNMLPLRKSCHYESSIDEKQLLFRKLHHNEQFKVPNSLMRPVQNRWEIKQPHFHLLHVHI